VLRWSALGLGVFYGIYHQASISARDRLENAKREYKHKEDLISQAKAEWQRRHSPAAAQSTGGNSPLSLPPFDVQIAALVPPGQLVIRHMLRQCPQDHTKFILTILSQHQPIPRTPTLISTPSLE